MWFFARYIYQSIGTKTFVLLVYLRYNRSKKFWRTKRDENESGSYEAFGNIFSRGFKSLLYYCLFPATLPTCVSAIAVKSSLCPNSRIKVFLFQILLKSVQQFRREKWQKICIFPGSWLTMYFKKVMEKYR